MAGLARGCGGCFGDFEGEAVADFHAGRGELFAGVAADAEGVVDGIAAGGAGAAGDGARRADGLGGLEAFGGLRCDAVFDEAVADAGAAVLVDDVLRATLLRIP